MKAIILAAGQGTRLKKYTENLPKGMLSFEGKTIIERQLDIYRESGISDIIIVRGYAADKINYSGVRYYTNVNYANTNMVESFMEAEAEFDDDIIVSYSDILFDKDMLIGMMNVKEDFAVAVDTNWKLYWQARYGKIDFDIESLSIDNDNNIIELGLENCKLEDIDARYVGLLKFSKGGLGVVKTIMKDAYTNYEDKPWKQSQKTVRKAYMTDLLQAIIEEGNEVKAIKFHNGWIEFDTNEDYEKAMIWIEQNKMDQFLKLSGI